MNMTRVPARKIWAVGGKQDVEHVEPEARPRQRPRKVIPTTRHKAVAENSILFHVGSKQKVSPVRNNHTVTNAPYLPISSLKEEIVLKIERIRILVFAGQKLCQSYKPCVKSRFFFLKGSKYSFKDFFLFILEKVCMHTSQRERGRQAPNRDWSPTQGSIPPP